MATRSTGYRSTSRLLACGAAAGALLFATSVAAQVARAYPGSGHGGNYMHNYYLPPAPSSTPWAPAWSPDGRSIAVAMSGSIWQVDPETGAAWELTYNDRYHSLPAWSPDGRWIIYTADSGHQSINLEILDVETGRTHELTTGDDLYLDPVFSPDGTRVAYVASRPDGYFNVFIRPIRDGQWAGPEVAVTRDNAYGENRLYFGNWDMHLTPDWTRDGRELVIVTNNGVPLGSGNVVRIPAAGDGIDHMTTLLAEQTLYRARPHVSIDGRRFVYSSTGGAADQFNNLYVQPTVGGEPYKLTFFQHDAFHPRWSPDGEWIAYIDNREGLPQLALLETYGGSNRLVHITDRHYKRPTGVLTVRTLDDETGDVMGSRIHLKASDDKFYAPYDSYARVSGVGDNVFHHTGTFQVTLPAGRTEIDVVRGFEYVPQKIEADIREGEVTSVNVRLRRLDDMVAKGWYSASTHVHMNYAGNLHNTLENLMMMSDAEHQQLVLEQVANKDNRILDHQFFEPGGKRHSVSRDDLLVVVGQEYRPPFYGHVFMFLNRDNLISPFTTGYAGTAIESLYPSNTDMLRKARAQGAYVGYVHAFGGNNDPLEGSLGGGKGYMVDAALGTTDAVEWSNAGRSGFFPWYATLNNGLRVTAVGGEDSISNMQRSKLVGSVRTYVYTGGQGLDEHAWFEGMRNGHAFVSTGPLVELSVNGRIPGEQVDLPAGGGKVTVRARVRSVTPLERVELVANGEVIETIPLSRDRLGADFTRELDVTRSGWLHLRAEGDTNERYPLDAAFAQAFTNPVWTIVGGEPVRSRAAAQYSIDWIDELRRMAEEWPGWRSQREEDHVYEQFEEARRIYEDFLREAPAPAHDQD